MTLTDLEAPLSGYVIERTDRVAYLPAIISAEPGAGHVRDLLATLVATHDVVVVPCVVSERLRGMLERRDFHPETHYAQEIGEHVDCWVWRKAHEA